MEKQHEKLADYMTWYYTPFDGINGQFQHCINWQAHWRNRVYFELRRGWPLFGDKVLNESAIWIQQMTTPNVEDRRKGYAREVMEMLQYICGEFNCSLYLFPDPFEYIPAGKGDIWKYGTDDTRGIFASVGGFTAKQLTQFYGRLGFVPLRSRLLQEGEFNPWTPSKDCLPYTSVYNAQAYRNGQRPMLWSGSHQHSKLITKYRLFGSELPDDGSCEHLRNLTCDPECLCDSPNFMDTAQYMNCQKVVT